MINLPDSRTYDLTFELLSALERHDRPKAVGAWDSMNQLDPEHRLSLQGFRCLAAYDGDPTAELSAAQRLIEKYPDDERMKLVKLNALRSLGRCDDRIAALEEICGKGKCDPVFYQELAGEISADARELPRSIRLLRRVLRRQFRRGASLHALAGQFWSQLDRQRALELYRFTACLDDKNETAAQDYFLASQHLRKTDEALALLRARFDRFGSRSSLPARTLHWALDGMWRGTDASAVLEEACRRRPDDGDLLLYMAKAHVRYGGEKARTLLNAAAGRTRPADWFRGRNRLTPFGRPGRGIVAMAKGS